MIKDYADRDITKTIRYAEISAYTGINGKKYARSKTDPRGAGQGTQRNQDRRRKSDHRKG